MWFIYAAYLLLRASDVGGSRREAVLAVLGVVAFLDVPLVFISARYWRSIHPAVFGSQGGGLEPEMWVAALANLAAMACETLPGAFIGVARAPGDKCARCWIYSEDLGASPDYPDLCPRCAGVMTTLSFQDLTGQRIKRIIGAIKKVEQIVFDLYLSTGIQLKAREQAPDKPISELKAEATQKVSALKGPQTKTNQGDVDDLLAQLGLD